MYLVADTFDLGPDGWIEVPKEKMNELRSLAGVPVDDDARMWSKDCHGSASGEEGKSTFILIGSGDGTDRHPTMILVHPTQGLLIAPPPIAIMTYQRLLATIKPSIPPGTPIHVAVGEPRPTMRTPTKACVRCLGTGRMCPECKSHCGGTIPEIPCDLCSGRGAQTVLH